DTLSFSKERLQGKVAEFQEKYEFNRISSTRNRTPWRPDSAPKLLSSAASGEKSFWSEFSELEMDRYDDVNILSRSMAEISADVNEVLSQLGGFIGRVEGDIDEFSKLAHHLQDEITAARMVPIGTLYSRLSRAVRDAAKSTNKEVELELTGSETELDNNIIQQISDPLVHLVRNAVAHGIEPSGDRVVANKPQSGKIMLRAYHRGNHIYIEVEDDGRGIEYHRVTQSAIERGLVSVETADRLTERGLRADEIEDVGGKLLTKVRDVVTEVIRLDTYLGLPPLEPVNGFFHMVVANAGNHQVGLVVEEVLGKDEIVIKNLGEYLRRVKLFPGTTIAPDGSLILLIDLNRMVAAEPTEFRPLQATASAARIFAPGSAAV